jgi:hypothetical protein
MINGIMIRIDAVRILSFSVRATIAKITAKIKIKVVNKIPKSRLKFICATHIIDSGPYIYGVTYDLLTS